MTTNPLWLRYQGRLCRVPGLGLSLDTSRIGLDDEALARLAPAIDRAYAAMDALEKGAIANPDENRMVGHYWLRAPDLAPTPEIGAAIRETLAAIRRFAEQVHAGAIRPQRASRFARVLSIGIGGSALGPMFVADALGD